MDAEAWYAETRTHRIEGLRTVVRRDGAGSALVCLHGFPTSGWDFAPLWPALTGHFDCLAPDLIGLGRASKPTDLISVAMQADMVEAVCAAEGVTTAALLAHDLGDTVAQELLARAHEGSAKVTWTCCALLNGGLFPETHRARLIQQLLASKVGPLVAALSSERTFRKNMKRVFGPDTPPSEAFLTGSWRLLASGDGKRALPALIRYMDERRTHRARWVAPLVDASLPIRLINGVLDPVSGGHMVDRFEALVADADVVRLPRLGHYPHVEDPEAVLSALLPFLLEESDAP
ncbi:MAG: alpha/beta hydrolase [Myxococcota bacterium]